MSGCGRLPTRNEAGTTRLRFQQRRGFVTSRSRTYPFVPARGAREACYESWAARGDERRSRGEQCIEFDGDRCVGRESAAASAAEQNRAARHGLVPCRRAGGRDQRQAGARDRAAAGRTAHQARSNGQYMVERCMCSFPAEGAQGQLPLLLWHGGGLTGVTYSRRPTAAKAGSTCSCARAGTRMCRMQSSGRAASRRPDVWPSEPTFLLSGSLASASHRRWRRLLNADPPSVASFRAASSGRGL